MVPKEAQGMFQNILLVEYHGTFLDTPTQEDSFFFLLTLKMSLSGRDDINNLCLHNVHEMIPLTLTLKSLSLLGKKPILPHNLFVVLKNKQAIPLSTAVQSIPFGLLKK
jgi:hypothetical protein